MAEFLSTQLDYVYFVYGLAVVLLGAVASSISRAGAGGLAWGWLAGFGLVHGLGEWLHLLGFAVVVGPAFSTAIAVLMLLSYLSLLEFARRSQAVITGRSPGPWLIGLAAAAPVAVALATGAANLDPAMRLLVALPASLWAATVLVATSRRHEKDGGNPSTGLTAAALLLGAYGLAAGVIVPASPLLPEWWPTRERLLAGTGVPVAVIRSVILGGAALSLWAYACSLDERGRVVRKRWRFFWGTAGFLVLVLAAGWVATERLGRMHERDLAADAESAAAQVQDHLLMETEGARDAARIAAALTVRLDLAPAIARGGSPRLDDVVDVVAGGLEDRVAYLLDREGRTVAASNRGRPDSFLGKVYATRPYFQQAMERGSGRFIGRGITSGQPGFYAAEPIRDAGGSTLGVAVVKQALGPESFGPLGTGSSFLVGPDGRVLVTGVEALAGRPMWPGAGPPGSPLPADEPERVPVLAAPFEGTVRVQIDGVAHAAVRLSLPGLDWSIVTLRRETHREENRLLGILVTLLFSLVIVAAFVILQRQLGAESAQERRRREAEGKAREASRRADTDALTGIPNRQAFNEALAREFARARRFRQPLSVVLVDLDHFKRVNDEYGHPAGDQVLTGAARLLESRVRESDLAARWGGEEFAVIASMTDAAGAVRLAEKLRALLEVTHLGPPLRVTASFGVAELRPDDTLESLLGRADEALYRAKEGGRNRVGCGEAWVDMDVVALAEASRTEDDMGSGLRVYMDTGFGPIDEEHRALSTGLEQFIGRVNGGKVDEVRKALGGVVREVGAHFSHEEALMRAHHYPDRARHEEAHLLFVGDVKRFQAELERHGISDEFRRWAVSRLPEWFRYHILAHDVALGKFLQKVGAPGTGGRARGAAEGVVA